MSAATASIIAAAIAAVGAILAAYLNKVHKDNRGDHAVVATKIKDLHTDVREMKNDMFDVKIDVGILKSRHGDLSDKVTKLEETHY